MAIIKKQKFGTATIHQTASGTTVIAGNSSVSNVISAGETLVTGATVRKAMFSSNGAWSIYRGSNLIAVLHGTGVADWAGNGISLEMDKAGTLVANLSASSVGYIVIEVAKESR